MTVEKNLVKIGAGTKYRYSSRLRERGATVTYKFNGGITSLGQMVNTASAQFPDRFEADPRLPLRSVEITAEGGGYAVGVAQYGLRGVTTSEVFRRTARAAQIEVWHSADDHRALNREWDPSGKSLLSEKPMARQINVTQHSLVFKVDSYAPPKWSLDSYVDRANLNAISYENVHYPVNTLWFNGYSTVHLKNGGYDEWETTVQMTYRTYPLIGTSEGWIETYAGLNKEREKLILKTRRLFGLIAFPQHFV